MNKNFGKTLRSSMVPILFIVICGIGIIIAKPPIASVTSELATRLVRNTFLVLSLLIPIMAGGGRGVGSNTTERTYILNQKKAKR